MNASDLFLRIEANKCAALRESLRGTYPEWVTYMETVMREWSTLAEMTFTFYAPPGTSTREQDFLTFVYLYLPTLCTSTHVVVCKECILPYRDDNGKLVFMCIIK